MIIIEGTNITLPVGDTGSFDINTQISGREVEAGDRLIFTVKNSSGEIIKEVIKPLEPVVTISFINGDTDTLKPGTYTWDVRYVFHPYYDASGRIVDGDAVETPKTPMSLKLLNVVGEV